MKKIGIYSITNLNNGKVYIGSSINIQNRWMRHLYDLRLNRHHSLLLQRSYLKHGEQAFVFKILEECSIDDLLIIEQKYLDELLPVYNICPSAKNCLGKKDTDITRQKKREVSLKLGLKPPKETWEKRQIKVTMCDNEFCEIKNFPSLAEACRFIGKNHTFASTITRAIKRNIKAYGYKWKYSI